MNNPYRDDAFWVGRSLELEELRANIERGDSTLLIGGRRAGKTSLLERVSDVGRPVYLTSTERWVLSDEQAALGHLAEALGLQLARTSDLNDARRAFEQAITTLLPVCVAIDEADRILGEPWAGSFLVYLRGLIGQRFGQALAFVLVGGPALSGYSNPDDYGSPPLNLAERLYLSPLDAQALEEFVAPLNQRFPLADIRELAGAHPWLLRRLLRELWAGKTWEKAWEKALDACHHEFPVWARQLGDDGVRLLRQLPLEGVRAVAFLSDPYWIPHRAALVKARYVCAVTEEDGIVRRGPKMFVDWLDAAAATLRAWDLAISYASEDVALARQIFDGLKQEFAVFFAEEQRAYLWGHELSRVLPNTYGEMARYVLVLSTTAYLGKHWTLLEFNAAMAARKDNVLLVKLDGLPADSPPNLAYLEGSPANLVGLVADLERRLRA